MKSKLWWMRWMLLIVIAPGYYGGADAGENGRAATPAATESAPLTLRAAISPEKRPAKLVAWGQAVYLPGEKSPPANSLELVECAADLGFDAIELDIRISRDGVPVLAHDDRLPGDAGRISGHSFSALKEMPKGKWRGRTVRIASLEEALALERRPKVIVADMRVKASDGETVAEVVRRNMDAADFIFTAYDIPMAQAFRLALPTSRVFLKTYDTVPDIQWIDSAAGAGLSGVMFQVRDSLAIPLGDIVTAARDRGLGTMTFVHTSGSGETRLNVQFAAGVDHILTTRLFYEPAEAVRTCVVDLGGRFTVDEEPERSAWHGWRLELLRTLAEEAGETSLMRARGRAGAQGS